MGSTSDVERGDSLSMHEALSVPDGLFSLALRLAEIRLGVCQVNMTDNIFMEER